VGFGFSCCFRVCEGEGCRGLRIFIGVVHGVSVLLLLAVDWCFHSRHVMKI
jgi:hypothetical protein